MYAKGTSFTCLIPQQATYQHISKNNTQPAVLVVEDNFIAQTVAKMLLSTMNCQVDVASNGADAISFCKQNHYDLIFMDIGLGDEMNGYEVTNHIRNISHQTKTPIVALTAHRGKENKQRCIEAGMNAVVNKPLTQANAIDILKSFIPVRHEASSAESTKIKRDLPDSYDELFQLNQYMLFDLEDALKNCGTQEMLNELLVLMTEELPADLKQMKNAFEQQSYSLVEKIAHKIKGGAVYVGTIRMKYACQYLERYWKSGERELFGELYHQAVRCIEETISCIEDSLRKNI